jgi:hypothetical protein
LRFVLLTDPSMGICKDILAQVHQLYVDYVIKNPLNSVQIEKVDNELFETGLQKLMRTFDGFDTIL